MCRHDFNIRMGVWNALSGALAEAHTIVSFKRLSGRHMDMQGTGGYGSRAGTGD